MFSITWRAGRRLWSWMSFQLRDLAPTLSSSSSWSRSRKRYLFVHVAVFVWLPRKKWRLKIFKFLKQLWNHFETSKIKGNEIHNTLYPKLFFSKVSSRLQFKNSIWFDFIWFKFDFELIAYKIGEGGIKWDIIVKESKQKNYLIKCAQKSYNIIVNYKKALCTVHILHST